MKPSWKAHSTISICDIQHWIGKHKLHLKTNFSYENDKVSEILNKDNIKKILTGYLYKA